MLTASPFLADRFTWLFDGLCRVIGIDARKQRMEAALAWAIWHRVRALGDRLIALAERVRAGRLPRRSMRHGTSPRPSRESGEVREAGEPTVRGATSGPPAASLPRAFGWVRRMLPETGQYAGALRFLLSDPETAALVEKAPEAGRILRPLCHLLGVQAPAFLRPGGVVAEDARAAAALQAPRAEVPERLPEPEPSNSLSPSGGVRSDAPATSEQAVAPPAAPAPPPSGRSAAEEAALAHARRPGGLYWDGTRMRWS